jgi:hypothetical protein
MAEVKVWQAEDENWLVTLEGVIVGRFALAFDALDWASLLECDPRERLAALAPAS